MQHWQSWTTRMSVLIAAAFAALGSHSISIGSNGASDFGGATPINPREWVTPDDWPSDPTLAYEEGVVVVNFDISEMGQARNCKVVVSSGHERLDAIPCRVIEARAWFEPALDAGGKPKPTKAQTSIVFSRPRE